MAAYDELLEQNWELKGHHRSLLEVIVKYRRERGQSCEKLSSCAEAGILANVLEKMLEGGSESDANDMLKDTHDQSTIRNYMCRYFDRFTHSCGPKTCGDPNWYKGLLRAHGTPACSKVELAKRMGPRALAITAYRSDGHSYVHYRCEPYGKLVKRFPWLRTHGYAYNQKCAHDVNRCALDEKQRYLGVIEFHLDSIVYYCGKCLWVIDHFMT